MKIKIASYLALAALFVILPLNKSLAQDNESESSPLVSYNITYTLHSPDQQKLKQFLDFFQQIKDARIEKFGEKYSKSGHLKLELLNKDFLLAKAKFEEIFTDFVIVDYNTTDNQDRITELEQRRSNLNMVKSILEKELTPSSDGLTKSVLYREISSKLNTIKGIDSQIKRLSHSLDYASIIVNWGSEFRNGPTAGDRNTLPDPIKPAPPTVTLSKVGDEIKFNANETVELKLDYDKEQADLRTSYNGQTNEMLIKVVDNTIFQPVVIGNKCEMIIVPYGPIPQIIPAANLDPEQIIITPIVEGKGNIKGYEIRYGTIESGCKDGRKILAQFRKYYPMKHSVAPHHHIKAKRKTK